MKKYDVPQSVSKLVKLIQSMEGMNRQDKIGVVLSNIVLAKLLEYNKTGFNLPEGLPFDGEGLIFEDMTNIYQEARRLYIFSKNPQDNPPEISGRKREDLFLEMIKGLNKEEGMLLSAVKDGKLHVLYPQLEEVC